ncbi:MAG: tail fiber domain-containing protein, partial [Chlorobi bacterium]|nr:tail fiber domain-containing protein [Chlorobiota bacterium]
VFIGDNAGYNGTDLEYNVFVGYSAGKNATGNSNVFVGYKAGFNETGSNKLYIENSNSTSPLIYGDFSSDDVTINGDLTVTGTITELSDRRYKTDIKPMKNALQKIEAINAVYYRWDKEKYPDLVVSDEREIGVIAQDVEKVFPELVKTDNKGFKSVNYAKLSAVLLEVAKEQRNELESIKNELSEIKNANKKLEAKYSEQAETILKLTKTVKLITDNNYIKVTAISK